MVNHHCEMAFLTSVPVSTLPSKPGRTIQPRRQTTAKAKKPTHAKLNQPSSKPIPSKRQNQPVQTNAESLKASLIASVSGLNRGLSIDPDADVLTPEEAIVEDIISSLENINEDPEPTRSPHLSGAWVLLYASSSITRFFGGVTGFQRLLPGGEVGEIKQVINTEDGTSKYIEDIKFEIPVIGNVEWVAIAEGGIRKISDVRMVWEPESVKMGWFNWFADGWKTLRAFQISDITYIDDTIRITRGTTGSVHVYRKL